MNEINEETATPDDQDTELEQEQSADLSASETETGDDPPAKEELSETQKRINEITRQKYDAQRAAAEETRQKNEALAEAAYYRGLAEASKQTVQEPPEPALDPDDFSTNAEYAAALEARITKKVNDDLAKKQADADAVLQAEREAAEAQKRTQSLNTFVEDGRKKFDDWDEVLSTQTSIIPPEIAAMITSEDPALCYSMIKDGKINEVAAMSPLQAAKEIGKLVAKIQKEPPKQKITSNAPKPIKSVGGGASPQKVDLYDLKASAYVEARKKQMMASKG